MLSKEVSSTILKVFGMMWPGIEPRSPGPLENTLPTMPMCTIITSSTYMYYDIIVNSTFKMVTDKVHKVFYVKNLFIYAQHACHFLNLIPQQF